MIQDFMYGKNVEIEVSYSDLLDRLQQYLTMSCPNVIENKDKAEMKSSITTHIIQYIIGKKIKASGYGSLGKLVESLYKDMVEFSFISELLEIEGLEEININAWNDIEIIVLGDYKKTSYKFQSPKHAIDTVKRMLQESNISIDAATPIAGGSLGKNIRIQAMISPIVDEDVGVSASIRIVNPNKLNTDDLIKSNTATKECLDFLKSCINYGVSLAIAGDTGSGKTTLSNVLLDSIPNNKRVYSIEDTSREVDLVKKDENGKVLNRVVCTLTKKSLNKDLEVIQDNLLDTALRFHPDIIFVGEMRGEESFTAQEASRTGHTVLTTIHSNTAVATYKRMLTLAVRKHEMNHNLLLELMVEAYPIIVYMYNKKVVQVIEGVSIQDGKVVYKIIFDMNDKGILERKEQVSNGLIEILKNKMIPADVLKLIKGG